MAEGHAQSIVQTDDLIVNVDAKTVVRRAQIFNNDSTLTSAILDRVLHHADTVIIEGKSFRMKDEIEE